MNQEPPKNQSDESLNRLQEDFASRQASDRPVPNCVARAYRKIMDQKRTERKETDE